MRPKILAAIFAGIILAVVAIFIWRREPAHSQISVAATSSSKTGSNNIQHFRSPEKSLGEKIPAAANHLLPLAATNSVEERVAALEMLGSRDDPESLQKILSALNDADRAVRQAAVAAVVQFGSRDAIPALKEIAAQKEDAREKVEILDAIEFLELPPLSEVRSSARVKSRSSSGLKK